MFCPKCGGELAEGSAFCGMCGERVRTADTVARVNGPAMEDADAGMGTGRPRPAAVQGSASSQGTPSGVAIAGKGVPKVAIAGVLAAAVVGAIAIGAFASSGPSSSSVPESDAPSAYDSSADDSESSSSSDGEADAQDQSAQAIEVKASVDDYTWDELSRISQEISAAGTEDAGIEVAKGYNLCYADGTLDGTQVKSVQLSNGVEGQVQIIGFNQDDKSDGTGKAGITFLFVDCIAKHEMNSYGSRSTNAGGWRDSTMRSYLDSEVYGTLPSELSNVIVAVDKRTNNTGELDYLRYSPSEMAAEVTTTSDKLWLPSLHELTGASSPYDSYPEYNELFPAEGQEYKLFRDMGVIADDNNGNNQVLLKSFDGKDVYWWERSPSAIVDNGFECVLDNGSATYGSNSSNENGVVPGFCI